MTGVAEVTEVAEVAEMSITEVADVSVTQWPACERPITLPLLCAKKSIKLEIESWLGPQDPSCLGPLIFS